MSYATKKSARFMQDGQKAVWRIPYVVSAAFFPSLRHNFIAYRFPKVSDCIFEIHQLWQSGFSRVYSNCCCSCSFEPEILKIGQSYHKMYSNNIVNFQESTTILNACTKKSGNLLKAPRMNTLYLLVSFITLRFTPFAICTYFLPRIYIYIYIVIGKKTVSLYQNSSVWLDT